MLLPPVPEPDAEPKGPIIHIYRLDETESTPGGHKFFGIKYEGTRPTTAFDDNIESVKARLK
jgi:hypothetical protein